MIAAGGANADRRIYGTAIVAMQLSRELVKIERYVAVVALRDPAADLADLNGRIAATVLEKDDLAAVRQRLPDLGMQGRAEDRFAVVARAGEGIVCRFILYPNSLDFQFLKGSPYFGVD